jgi:hypothetical protein
MKFTFKKEEPHGRYKSFDSTTYLIKLKRKKCGYFFEKHSEITKVYFSIEKDEKHDDGNPNCSWMNISLKKEFKTAEEVKAFLINNTEAINNKYKLHFN